MALPPMNTMDDTDLVERLRGPAPHMIGPLMDEAADEIERLTVQAQEFYESWVKTREALELGADKIGRLTVALEIIAGRQQCIDNLMSNVDVACAALDGGKP